MVADRDGLSLQTIQGDMADLSCFEDGAFDFIFHPCSNCFAKDIKPVWREAYRVLRPGGSIVSGFVKPIHGLFDPDLERQGTFQLRFSMPHSDLKLSDEERETWFGSDAPIEFVHSLGDQLGGQLDAGFLIAAYMKMIGAAVSPSISSSKVSSRLERLSRPSKYLAKHPNWHLKIDRSPRPMHWRWPDRKQSDPHSQSYGSSPRAKLDGVPRPLWVGKQRRNGPE